MHIIKELVSAKARSKTKSKIQNANVGIELRKERKMSSGLTRFQKEVMDKLFEGNPEKMVLEECKISTERLPAVASE